MLLTFSKPQFVGFIKTNIKKHTIRADKHNRWKIGTSIQFWSGNPRNIKAKNKPYKFGNAMCSAVLPIEIYPSKNKIIIDGCKYSHIKLLNRIAQNDGFSDWEEMKEFFNEDFFGKIIYWINFEPINN
jgi:hypothetical protein